MSDRLNHTVKPVSTLLTSKSKKKCVQDQNVLENRLVNTDPGKQNICRLGEWHFSFCKKLLCIYSKH